METKKLSFCVYSSLWHVEQPNKHQYQNHQFLGWGQSHWLQVTIRKSSSCTHTCMNRKYKCLREHSHTLQDFSPAMYQIVALQPKNILELCKLHGELHYHPWTWLPPSSSPHPTPSSPKVICHLLFLWASVQPWPWQLPKHVVSKHWAEN